jgi:hypothetical protein
MRWVLRKDLVGDTSIHEAGALRIIASSMRIAFFSGFTWAAGMLAAVSMTCWGVAAWVLLPMLVLSTFVIALLLNGARAALERQGGIDPIQLPSPEWFADLPVQALVRRLEAARTTLERVARESPRGPAFDVSRVREGAAEIERRVIVLAARAEYVGSFLSATSVAEIKAALERARARARSAPGEELAGMYGRLVETYERRLRSVSALEAEKEKLLATGEQLVGTLEGFPADLTRLQCLRLAVVDEGAAQTSIENADALRQNLNALEEALQEEAAVAD